MRTGTRRTRTHRTPAVSGSTVRAMTRSTRRGVVSDAVMGPRNEARYCAAFSTDVVAAAMSRPSCADARTDPPRKTADTTARRRRASVCEAARWLYHVAMPAHAAATHARAEAAAIHAGAPTSMIRPPWPESGRAADGTAAP